MYQCYCRLIPTIHHISHFNNVMVFVTDAPRIFQSSLFDQTDITGGIINKYVALSSWIAENPSCLQQY